MNGVQLAGGGFPELESYSDTAGESFTLNFDMRFTGIACDCMWLTQGVSRWLSPLPCGSGHPEFSQCARIWLAQTSHAHSLAVSPTSCKLYMQGHIIGKSIRKRFPGRPLIDRCSHAICGI